MMRSKLFVPGTRPEFFPKAMVSAADAVCFDLEDSVLLGRKQEARALVRDFLDSLHSTRKQILIRVNGLRSGLQVDDLKAVLCPGVALLVLPKVEAAADLVVVVETMSGIEKQRGLSPVSILATIESPRGLRVATEIAHGPRVAGLQLGLMDLFDPLGIRRDDRQAVHSVRLALRLASGEAGIPCYDSAEPDFADHDCFKEQAIQARGLGFSGKSCIHPSQIAVANEVFSLTTEEIARAHQIVEASRSAEGAFAMEGVMMDEPMVKRARQILREAEDSGKLSEDLP